MKKLTEKVKKEIKERLVKNQPKVYWDYNSGFDSGTVKRILAIGNLCDYMTELYEDNLEYVWELEDEAINEIKADYEDYDEGEIEDFARSVLIVDMNEDGLISMLPNIPCLLYVQSNYDCCNSFDKLEPDGYLYEVYKRVKKGVKKDDYMHEFYNGAYGGALFCFGFNTDVKTILELKDAMEKGKSVTIPKGTQFGFHSSFQGASTPFEKTTYRKMTIPVKESGDGYYEQYDNLELIADIEQHYSVADVCGQNVFNGGSITVN